MTYEIRVVFQSFEAYRSAVEGLYRAFGVDLPGMAIETTSNGALEEPTGAVLPRAVVPLDTFLAEDPLGLADEPYVFNVEDRTRT
ncbi:MAG TPA: hypothetical protein VHK89_05380 [Actinomycetota bacterium]|nr:hypothetical protein [Actinomycetota bacterium]